MKDRNSGIIKTVIAVLIFITLVVGGFVYQHLNQPFDTEALKKQGVYLFEQPRNFGSIQFLDQNDKVFDNTRLKGKWSIVFFGYTFCPDVCPTTMLKLREMKQLLEGSPYLYDTQFIMVTADPARDNVDILKNYVEYFDPEFIGITGDFVPLYSFANKLNSAFTKVPGGGENYLVDHSSNLILINSHGDYQGFIKPMVAAGNIHTFDPEQLAKHYELVRSNYNY